MATNDVNLQVINSMSQAKMNSLKNSDGKIPELANQLIMTNEEDVNLSQMTIKELWKNPNPSSAFASQTITLSSNDYDFLLVFYYSNTVDKIVLSTVCEKGNRFELSRAIAYASGYYTLNGNRNCDWVSNTQYSVGNASTAFVNANGSSERISVNNGDLIPVSIYGLKKSPSMIYTGAELHEGDGIKIENGVISTTNSNDSQVLLYSSSGVNSGTITLGDISPYKFITIATSDDNNFKTINVYSVKSLLYMINNNGFGIYGYSSNFINCTCSGSINNFSLNLISYTNQKILAIWGVK